MKNSYCVLTFHTTHYALKTEKVLKEKNIPVRLKPVPRQISSSCGIAAEVPCSMKKDLAMICHEFDIQIDNFYCMEKENQKKGLFRSVMGILK